MCVWLGGSGVGAIFYTYLNMRIMYIDIFVFVCVHAHIHTYIHTYIYLFVYVPA